MSQERAEIPDQGQLLTSEMWSLRDGGDGEGSRAVTTVSPSFYLNVHFQSGRERSGNQKSLGLRARSEE